MLDLDRNFGRLSALCANALLVVALAAISAIYDAPGRPGARGEFPTDWHAPLAMTAAKPDADTRYGTQWIPAR